MTNTFEFLPCGFFRFSIFVCPYLSSKVFYFMTGSRINRLIIPPASQFSCFCLFQNHSHLCNNWIVITSDVRPRVRFAVQDGISPSFIHTYIIDLVSCTITRASPCIQSTFSILEPCVADDHLVILAPFNKSVTSFISFIQSERSHGTTGFFIAYFRIPVTNDHCDISGFAFVNGCFDIIVKCLDLTICWCCCRSIHLDNIHWHWRGR